MPRCSLDYVLVRPLGRPLDDRASTLAAGPAHRGTEHTRTLTCSAHDGDVNEKKKAQPVSLPTTPHCTTPLHASSPAFARPVANYPSYVFAYCQPIRGLAMPPTRATVTLRSVAIAGLSCLVDIAPGPLRASGGSRYCSQALVHYSCSVTAAAAVVSRLWTGKPAGRKRRP